MAFPFSSYPVVSLGNKSASWLLSPRNSLYCSVERFPRDWLLFPKLSTPCASSAKRWLLSLTVDLRLLKLDFMLSIADFDCSAASFILSAR